ncbi:MAG TPA: RHS repeat-associated core domain-containing protein [Ktedonobacteraceae bacterium]|nr:RHS repeat-associated core domain-containing protein [Ktedonobacteraceae bacterium]
MNQRTTSYEQTGSPNNNAPWVESDYTYDDYSTSSGLGDYHQSPAHGSYHNVQQEVISGSNIPTLTKHWTYYTSNSSSSIYFYYQAHTVAHSDIVDSQGHMWACQDITYDEGVGNGVPQPAAGWPTTVVSYSDCSHQSTTTIKTYNGYDNYGDLVASVDGFAAANPSLYSSAGCTLSTAPTIFPTSSWSSSHYTVCHKYDPVSSLTTDTWNVLGQHTSTAYDATQGQLPISSTDVNGQVTTMSYSYDGSGNKTVQVKLPNESGSYTSQSTLTSNCSDSSVYPCLEIDTNSSLYSGAVTRTFYDSQGRAVETLTPGPDGSHTIVTFTVYYDQTHSVYTSFPFVVNSRTTWLDPNGATDDTGATPYGTAKYLDPLGPVISTNDAYSYQTHTSYSLGSANGDSQTYLTTTFVDANNHVQVSFSDALGRTRYVQTYSGVNGGTLTPNMQVSTQYNALDKPTSIVVTDLAPQSGQTITSVTTTIGYDDMGRMTSLNDPDRGLHTYGYDADGRVLVDVSGSRTLGVSYDLLGRPGCIQDANPTTDGSGNCSSGSHPLVQNTYDTSKLGTQGTTDFPVGQLTQSVATTYYDTTYTNKSTVTEQFQHDQRGQLVTATLQIAVPSGWGLTTSLPLYQEATSYNDAGQPTMLKTTVGGVTGYTIGEVYDSATGTLTGLNNTGSGSANLATLAYNPQDQISDINFQTTSGTPLADDNFTYDKDLRPAGSTASWQSGSGSSGTLFSTSRTYDPVGNVISVSTTHAAIPGQSGSGGSETQNFCYDEQNRLVWAGNSGTQPSAGNGTCGNGTLSNSLSGATYSSSFVYTHLGQLWQGPLNGGSTQEQYLYCNTNKPHQLVGLYPLSSGANCSNYTSKTADYATGYDAWGNATSRNTGSISASLSFDTLDHLVVWNAGSTSQAWYAYDASGNRVLSRTITSSGTSLTTYAFGVEEHTYSATGTNTGNTYYYSLGGHLIGELTGTSSMVTQFFLTDALGSVLASFSDTPNSATVLGNQVYGPYGNQRYLKGSMGTAKGYTGQYADPTGLDYYNARYYDPVAGVFVSADSKQGNAEGMNPYAYVAGNPETFTDPSGQYVAGPGGQTYIPGAPYYMQGGQKYRVPNPPPFHDPGTQNGGHPGQGPSTQPTKSSGGSSNQPTSSSPPGRKQTNKQPWCFTVCGGVKDWWQIGKGVVGILGNSAALGTLVAAFLGADASTDGAASFLANFVASVGLGFIHNIIEGFRGIADNFNEHNPVLDIVADILEIGSDLLSLASMGKGFQAIKELGGVKSSLQVARLFNAVGQMFSGKSVDFTKYVGPATSTIMGILTTVSTSVTLVQDGLQLGSDISEYNSYAANHDPSAGWNTSWW